MKFVRQASELTRGYAIAFDEELVRQHGIMGFMKWGRSTEAALESLFDAFGDRHTHLLAAFASMWNGCDYCTFGHLLALNLYVYRDTGTFFPIDEAETGSLLRMRDGEVLAELEKRLTAQYPEMVRLVKRQHELRHTDGAARGDEDRLILRSVALYEWINECSITVDAPAPPLGRIAMNQDVRRRYAEARAAWRAEQAPARPA